ncbi:glycosyltransferase family 2 protein [Halobacterium salinarum]|uniref:glycosyltransferase family 2 protein n=1 Tax=Halobacterium salinarum TaxID=2242 RepID=UPI0025571824|nr:glycosyltransferase family 2 protein [Halobacterium salinarum]MDL0131625.1 glycosyltransferase family 2 protein [Halobacterium salinarum]
MSQPDSTHSGQAIKEQKTQQDQSEIQPVFGFIAAPDLVVLENIVDAQKQGSAVIVVNPGDEETDTAKIARELGADVFTPPASDLSTDELIRQLWTRANANYDRPVIVAEESTTPIDIGASIEAYDVDTEINTAVPQKANDEVDVLVGIPAYNESATIGDVVTETKPYADHVIVVDDASTDATAQKAKAAGATVVSHNDNQGYGAALKTVFEEAVTRNAQHLVILDGDGQHDANDIPKAIQTQKESKADIVIGSRFEPDSDTGLPLYRRLGLAIVNTLTNLSMGVIRRKSWVRDTQSGFRTYNRDAITSLSEDESLGNGMNASTDILFHAHEHGYDIKEVGTTINYDVDNPSSHNPFSHGLTLVSNILKTVEREHPIATLGAPGFLSTATGIGFGYWTLSNFLNSGTFPIGLAIISIFFVLTGIFASFTGIILHSLNAHLN